MRTNVESHAVVALEPVAAFETITQSLADALELSGVVLDAQRGTIVDAAAGEIGRVVSWHPGVGATLALHGEQSAPVMLALTTEAVAEGTRIAVALRGLDDVLGEDHQGPAAWLGSQLLARCCAPPASSGWAIGSPTVACAARPAPRRARTTVTPPITGPTSTRCSKRWRWVRQIACWRSAAAAEHSSRQRCTAGARLRRSITPPTLSVSPASSMPTRSPPDASRSCAPTLSRCRSPRNPSPPPR